LKTSPSYGLRKKNGKREIKNKLGEPLPQEERKKGGWGSDCGEEKEFLEGGGKHSPWSSIENKKRKKKSCVGPMGKT